MCDRKIRVICVKLGFIGGGICFTLKNYDHAANKIRTSRTGDCEMQDQGVYASHDLDADRIILNSFCDGKS